MTTTKSSVTIKGKRAVSSSKKKDHIKIDIVVDSSFSGSSEQDRYSASPNENVDLIDTTVPEADQEGHDSESENGSTNSQEHNGQASIESKDVTEEVSIGKGSSSRSGFHGFHLLVAAAEQSFCGTTTSSTLNNVEESTGAKSVSYDEDDGGQNNSDSDEDAAVTAHPETDYSSPSILMMERRLQVEKYNNRLAFDKQNEAHAYDAATTTGQEVSNGNKKRVTFFGTSSAEDEVRKEGQKKSKTQNGVDEEGSDLNKRRRKKKDFGEISPPPPPVYHDRENDDYYRKQADIHYYYEEQERQERRALMKHEGVRRERDMFYHEDHDDPYYILRDEYGHRPHPHMSHEEHEQLLMRRDQLRYEHDVLRARKLLRRSQPPPPSLHLRSSYSAESGGEELPYDARPSRMLSPRLAPRDEYPPHEPSRGGRSICHVPIVPPEASSRDLPPRLFHPENAPASSYRAAPPSFWHDGGRRERIAFRPESPSNAAAAYEARAASIAERIEAQEEYEREKRFMIQEQHDAAAAASWRRGGHHHHHPPSPSMSSYPPSAALVTPVHREYATAPPHRYAASHRRDRAAAGAIPPFPEKIFHPYSREELPSHHEYHRERSSFHRHPDLGLVPINRSFPRSSGGRS